MEDIVQIDANFIEQNTHFESLIKELQMGFFKTDVLVPIRHHHDFPNPEVQEDTTLLLMPDAIMILKIKP